MTESITNQLISVDNENDIPDIYRDTPIGRLILYHNSCIPPDKYNKADILVLMCMDNRQELKLPKKFAFVVRNSGGTRNGVSFSITFAVAAGGVRHIVVIGHSGCMMVDLQAKKEEFVRVLSERGGWDRDIAESYFLDSCTIFDKKDLVNSVISEVELIRNQYPDTVVAPLFYSIEDDLLYMIEEQV